MKPSYTIEDIAEIAANQIKLKYDVFNIDFFVEHIDNENNGIHIEGQKLATIYSVDVNIKFAVLSDTYGDIFYLTKDEQNKVKQLIKTHLTEFYYG